MKHASLLLASVVLTACSAARQRAAVPAPIVQAKVRAAMLDVQKAILSSPDGLDAADELHRKFDPDKEKFDAQQQEIQKLRREHGDEARIADLERSYSLGLQDSRQKFEVEKNRLYKEVSDKVMAVVGEYAKQERFEFVVDVSDQKAPLFWRASEADITDITYDVVEMLKSR
jgi:Skp family chaperone for outer membrane proteins